MSSTPWRPYCPHPEKQSYSKGQAISVALKRSRDAGPLRVYRCRCGCYHLTRRAG